MVNKNFQPRLAIPPFILRVLSAIFVLSAMGLSWMQFSVFKTDQRHFPAGSTIAGVPMGGLERQEAGDRLFEVYNQPVELRYLDQRLLVSPVALGFQMDINAMLSAAHEQGGASSARAFWDYLWHIQRPAQGVTAPLSAEIDLEILQQFLRSEVSPRYDQPPTQAIPIPGQTIFEKGQPGFSIHLEESIPAILAALQSPTARSATLTVEQLPPASPSPENLKILLQQQIALSTPDTLVEIYIKSLAAEQTLHFAVQNREEILPDIAFTAASSIKIPVMVSVLRRTESPTPADIAAMLEKMIMFSKNTDTDRLMEEVIDPVYGPIYVTEDAAAMGLKNTFLGGYFYLGAPLLRRYETPANQRADIDLKPDIYNQTTPAEMGALLEGIYHCAEDETGLLVQTFPGKITSEECREMIRLLVGDRLPYLLTAGLPEGTQIAHKHGWIEEADGLLHTMGDAAVIYSPGGDYVLSVYMYHPDQLVFDEGNRLMSQISNTIYNFFNVYSMD